MTSFHIKVAEFYVCFSHNNESFILVYYVQLFQTDNKLISKTILTCKM